jgi:hypothetical protein
MFKEMREDNDTVKKILLEIKETLFSIYVSFFTAQRMAVT